MTISTDAHPLKSLRQRRNTGLVTLAGGPRSKRLAERQRLSVEAMVIARPFNGTVAALQAQIAELCGLLARGDNSASHPSLSDEADALGHAVYFEQLAFADATEALPPSVATNDRIVDTRKALDSAAIAIALVKKGLAKRHRGAPHHRPIESRP